ncbi:phosphonate transport system ATP-binding protein [Stutzerimonas xanthomarina]|uniref:Phosphonate transport system ATP-binding protein n=3 Tax=Stutzerimonas xanthomarina TaxID=271420 RepID=A0A1M5SM98_9GAMM|nr:phosphonate transport system ATP-binding protein [Stutzerimonas xanthomarina]SHH39681.1 phosphonate transport system ATP-binding protein [Stutzerimonas xanthomarina DSM 18231]
MSVSMLSSSPRTSLTNQTEPALSLSGVSYCHANGHVALRDVTLQLAHGERVALIGPSGAGKTTLLRLLATHLQPSTGEIELLGCQPWALSGGARQKLRGRIGLIHQAPPLPPRQRVITSVLAGRLGQWSLGRSLLSLVYPSDKDGAAEVLEKLDLADKLFERCDQLSGGQLQRVGIARALYQNPTLMLADEPVSAMDPVLAAYSLNVLNREAVASHATLVASLHAVELALEHFPRVIAVRDGRILFDKPSDTVTSAELDALYANEQLEGIAPFQQTLGQSLHIPRC